MAFSNSAIVNYPVEEVFSVFIRTAKRDFPKFNENNPIGASVKKKVGAQSKKSQSLNVEITDYKKNELYKITSTSSNTVYYSTYQFEKIDGSSTRITLIEENETKGIIRGINHFFQGLSFKGRIKKRFVYFMETLEREVENMREKLEKSSKSKLEEEKKINAKAEEKIAKESSLKAEKEAQEVRLAEKKAEVVEDKESGQE